MKRKPIIHVIGSYAVGMTMKTDRFPSEGETVPGYEFRQLHGGKGSNQAVASARMGGDVIFTSCIGNDTLGLLALEMLQKEGIDIHSVYKHPELSTGIGFVMVGPSGENEILIDLAANDRLSCEQIECAFERDSLPDILLMQLEVNVKAIYHAASLAKKRGIPVILNPAPFREFPEGLLNIATYITPNQTEAAMLLGKRSIPEEMCISLEKKYNTQVVLTAGKAGAYIVENGNSLRIPVPSVESVDTTGAGDCFNAALAVGLGEGRSLKDAVILANSAAALSVQVEGVIESLPERVEVQASYQKLKESV